MTERIADFDERPDLADQARRLLRAIRAADFDDHDRTHLALQLIGEATAILEGGEPSESGSSSPMLD